MRLHKKNIGCFLKTYWRTFTHITYCFEKLRLILTIMDCLLWDIFTYFRVFQTPNIQQIGKRRYYGVKEKEFDREWAEVNQETRGRWCQKIMSRDDRYNWNLVFLYTIPLLPSSHTYTVKNLYHNNYSYCLISKFLFLNI